MINKMKNLQNIVEPLLAWYDQNARILPWRENTEPYRVWVSEIMLQQTRVEAVIPYFERFLQALPTIHSLAEAPEEQLLKLWEGLGYYTRVRNLQKAAKIICNKHHGVFPEQYADILSLPGIGEYTVGAISSISFGKPFPAVDGNVLRVITRLTENYQDIGNSTLKEQIETDLKEVYPMMRSGDFTQSLMELGALLCLPNQSPKCNECPLSFLCKAKLNHTQMLLPVKKKKDARKQETKTVFILRCGDKIAIKKREVGGLLGGLWEFPNANGLLTEVEISEWLLKHNIEFIEITKSSEKKHIFTHIEWKMVCYSVLSKRTNTEFSWVTENILKQQISLPTAFRKLLD